MEAERIPTTAVEATTVPTTETKRRRMRRKHIRPEVGSFLDILHDHSGTSLFVLPICWTDLHTRLLGCNFTQLPAHNLPMPAHKFLMPPSTPSPRRSQRTPETVVTIGRGLDILMSTDGSMPVQTKTRALRTILSTFFRNHLSTTKACPDLDIRFGQRTYSKAVRCQAIWKQPDTSAMSFNSATTWTSSRSASQLMSSMTVNLANDTPILAYVSRSHLDHIRRHCFRVLSGPNRSFNGPVHRLQQLRSRNLIPGNIDEDQYFVAVMIAMAQQQVYTDVMMGAGFTPKSVKTCVLTISEEGHSFIVYSATVPAAFLVMLDQPDKAPKGDTQIKIEYSQAPVWPVLGLKERLGKALGKDIVGDFDGVSMDTYEDELPVTPESTSPKRRREVLSEVFNASFSEDRESESPGNVFKRRCIAEGRVGVVR
ncbi:Uu.00g075500.m01.CDS01 [Anthostomella pinea]|uniref:Uu.00g075500.m01.CDS01 n=1 Tax=Anthostomella pinea TaxID=933095 RepID=A0AAI8VWK4_9PEZI|nr:Uu.00g075500.m01.CDS01 [Anthostomella pinea]